MSATTEEITDLLKKALELKSLESRLWDAADIAALLGVKLECVRRSVINRPDFPADLGIPHMSKRWNPADVRAWLDTRPGPIEGPPRNRKPSGTEKSERLDRSPMAAFLRGAMRQAKKRAIKHSRSINITSIDMIKMMGIQGGRCAVSGVEFSLDQFPGSAVRPFAPSIDRVSSARGYELDNVRLVCHCVNLMMNEWGDAVFHALAAKIRGA